MKEIYIVGCHIATERQEKLLRRLINHLYFFKKDFILVSHTLVPQDLIDKSVGFIYDKSNPVYWRWDLEDAPFFSFSCPKFNILSKYILYGACPYYHVGVLRLFLNGLNYAKTLDYDVIHWIEYDFEIDFDRASENVKLIKEGNNFIFHGLGTFFSLSAKIEINQNFIQPNNTKILEYLKKNDYVAELVTMNEIFLSKPLKVFDVLKNQGDFSQNFDNVQVHWSLFIQNTNEIHIFLLNKQQKEIRVEFSYNEHYTTKILLTNMYHRSRLGCLKTDGKSKIEIKVDGQVFFILEDDSQNIYDKLIKHTKVWSDV